MQMTIGDFRCAYDVVGQGPFLTLFHSVGLSTREGWRNQIMAFSEHFTVISFDFRGLGQSTKGSKPLGVDTYVADTELLLQTLGVTETAIMGISLGGFVAQAFALKRPETVSAMVLVSTSCGHLPENQPRRAERIKRVRRLGMETAVDAQLDHQFPSDFANDNPAVIQWYREHYLANDPQHYADVLEDLGRFNSADRLGSVKCPTLIVGGDSDTSVVAGKHPLDSPTKLHGLIPGSNLAIIPGAKHYPQIDHAEVFNVTVLDYLRRHVG
jgi:3-oxoadipate enol-lactonase